METCFFLCNLYTEWKIYRYHGYLDLVSTEYKGPEYPPNRVTLSSSSVVVVVMSFCLYEDEKNLAIGIF